MAAPQQSTTRDRILSAAERLFGARGLEAPSIRSITAEAGVNVAAVHYHFGSRESLLREVLSRLLLPINQCRLEALDALGPVGDADLEAVLDAFLRPAFDTFRADPALGRVPALLLRQPDAVTRELLEDLFGEVVQRFESALAECLPALPRREIRERLGFVVAVMVHVLAGPRHGDGAEGVADLGRSGELVPLIHFLAAGLRAPASPGESV